MSNVELSTDSSLAYNDAGSNINIAEYLTALWESRWIIIVATLFMALVGVCYSLFATPIYQSDMLVQVEEADISSKSLIGDLAPLLGKAAATTAEIEIIRSRSVVGEAVKLLGLTIDARPRTFPIVGNWISKRNAASLTQSTPFAKPFAGLSNYAWGGESIVISEFVAPVASTGSTRWTVRAGENRDYTLSNSAGLVVLRGEIGVTAAAGNVSINIKELRGRPGTEYTVYLSSFLQSINELQSDLNVVEKGRQSGIINVALSGDHAERIAMTLNSIGEAYVKFNADRKSAEAEKTLQFLDKQLPALKKDLDASEERFNRYRIRSGTIDLSEEAKLMLQQSVEGNKGLLELQQKRLELMQRFTSAHPAVMAIDAQIAAIQREINGLSGRISRLPDVQQDALRLTRDVTVNNQLYTSLLNTAQQLRILKAGKIGNVRLVDYAVVGEKPVQPRKGIVITLATVIGLLLGVIIAVARKIILTGVESSDEIERVTGLPVLAAIPHSDSQKVLNDQAKSLPGGSYLLAQSSPQDLTIESLRSLRTALQFAMLESSNNLVMITGPAPDVGKSFISANLAAVLAATGKRVLLIDCDLRRGHLHDFFGKTRSPGLSSLIAGQSSFQDTLHKEVVPGLDFLATGSNVPNPAELLGSAQFSKLLETLSSQYDIVLVDTPPVLAVADAMIVGKYIGTSILNLRHGRHAMAEIQESIKRLQLGGVVVKGILLNAIPRRALGYGKYRYDGTYYNYDYTKPRVAK